MMLKRMVFISIFLFSLVFFVVTVRCYADVTVQISQAEEYLEAGDHELIEDVALLLLLMLAYKGYGIFSIPRYTV